MMPLEYVKRQQKSQKFLTSVLQLLGEAHLSEFFSFILAQFPGGRPIKQVNLKEEIKQLKSQVGSKEL